MDDKDRIARAMLKKDLLQLNKQQLKQFYGILVHAWASQKSFISKQNFQNLWCELNYNCAESDEGFPDPYDDYELLKSFCQAHPYYFVDILDCKLIVHLFCHYIDNRLDILATVVNKLRTDGLRSAYEHLKATIKLTEDIDELTAQANEHINAFS